jgi:hypothetical protein
MRTDPTSNHLDVLANQSFFERTIEQHLVLCGLDSNIALFLFFNKNKLLVGCLVLLSFSYKLLR